MVLISVQEFVLPLLKLLPCFFLPARSSRLALRDQNPIAVLSMCVSVSWLATTGGVSSSPCEVSAPTVVALDVDGWKYQVN